MVTQALANAICLEAWDQSGASVGYEAIGTTAPGAKFVVHGASANGVTDGIQVGRMSIMKFFKKRCGQSCFSYLPRSTYTTLSWFPPS